MFKRLGDFARRTFKTIGQVGTKIYNFINQQPVLKDFSNLSKNFLNEFGNGIIVGLKVCRAPINAYIQKFITNINVGNFRLANEIKKPDKLFHLWLEIKFNLNGNVSTCIYEKNDKPEFNLGVKSWESSINVGINKNLTILQMCEEAISRVSRERYFIYRWNDLNCQQFVKDNLNSSSFNYTENLDRFILQDLSSLIKQIGVQGDLLNKIILFFSKFKSIGGE